MEKHLHSVGMLFIFFGAQGVFIWLMLIGALMAGATLSSDPQAASVINAISLSIAIPFLQVEALKIVGGIGLLQRRPGARYLVLVLSLLSLFFPPIGTAYGIYAIWVLMKADTVRLLAGAGDSQ
jgi:hypothetical protein